LLAYGSALAHSGSLNHALDMIRRAVEAADGAGDAGLAWHARIEELSWRAQVETGAGVSAEILATVPEAVQRFGQLADNAGAARAWLSIASAHNLLGHHADALEAAERALDLAERAGNDGLVLDAYRRIGVAVIWGPLPLSEAERRYGNLLDRIGGGPLRKVAATELVAALKTQLGHVEEGRALIAKARELYNELGDRLLSAKAALIEHRGPLGEDDFATAEQIVGEACEILETAGERSWLSTSLAVWASTLYALDRLEDAYRQTVKSEQAGSADDAVTQAYWRAERAKVLARWGRGEEAIVLGRDAIRILDATDGVLEQADVYVAFGEVHRVLGHTGEARDSWVEALRRYEAKGAAPFARQIRVRLALLGGD
jgi:tetratricopeptide (TPR) repeat protein